MAIRGRRRRSIRRASSTRARYQTGGMHGARGTSRRTRSRRFQNGGYSGGMNASRALRRGTMRSSPATQAGPAVTGRGRLWTDKQGRGNIPVDGHTLVQRIPGPNGDTFRLVPRPGRR